MKTFSEDNMRAMFGFIFQASEKTITSIFKNTIGLSKEEEKAFVDILKEFEKIEAQTAQLFIDGSIYFKDDNLAMRDGSLVQGLEISIGNLGSEGEA